MPKAKSTESKSSRNVRWKFGMPLVNNVHYGWIQHFIQHLSPVGVAGFRTLAALLPKRLSGGLRVPAAAGKLAEASS